MNNKLNRYYENYDEEGRLFRDNTHNIEWITTLHYLKELIPPNSYIYDGCTGTGNYAFELAKMGHKVVASDIVPHNVDIIKKKQSEESKLEEIFVGDICNIQRYEKETFDVVLCMGAFYHLQEEERKKAMEECLRVCKQGGVLVISYINHGAVLINNLADRLENMDAILKANDTKTLDGIFLHTTPDEMENLAHEYKTEIMKHISADGLAYLYGDKIRNASQENFQKYMTQHLNTCEDKDKLGYSLHGLLFLNK